jgi:vitamin B12 transporter
MTTIGLAALLLWMAASDPVPPLKSEIVVTPERGAAERDDVAASVTVLTRKDIEALPAQSLAEVVSAIPGVTMDFDGAAAGAPMIITRGFFGGGETESVKLLIDGVAVGDAESGLIDWRSVRAGAIDRVEMLRGPGSSLYGDTAMGGVIEVFTRRDDDERGEVRLSSGTFGTRSADLFFRAGVAQLRAYTATTDGDRRHSASRDRGADLTLQRLGDASALRLTTSFTSKDREEPGPLTAGEDRRSSSAFFRSDREETQRRRIALSYDGAFRATLHASDRTTDFPRTLLLAPGFASTLLRHVESQQTGGTLEIAHDWTTAGVRAGTDIDRASVSTRYGDPIVASRDAHRDQLAFFATGDWQPIDRLRLSAGLRRDEIRDQSNGVRYPKSAWSPRIGATLHAGVTFFAQIGRAFKAPALDQLFDPRPFPGPQGAFTVSNPSLRPQRARNAEVGVSHRTDGVAWSVAAYRMNVTDEIDFDPTFFLYRNIGASRHAGVEAMAERREGSVQYTWTRLKLKNIPEHTARVMLHTTLPYIVAASVIYRWEHGRFADDDRRFPLADVRTLDAKLARAFGPLRVELYGQNLLDAHYPYVGAILNDFAGHPTLLEFPAQGRAVGVAMAWKY